MEFCELVFGAHRCSVNENCAMPRRRVAISYCYSQGLPVASRESRSVGNIINSFRLTTTAAVLQSLQLKAVPLNFDGSLEMD